MNDLLEKLEEINKRWIQIGEDVAQPDAMSDMKRYIKLNKDYKDLQPVVEAYKKYKNVIGNIANAKEVLQNEKDEEFRSLAKEELDQLTDEQVKMEEEIRILLLPKDPEDDKNAQVEIRAGTGGDEASIFAGDLFRMYQHFCDKKGWKIDVISMTEGTVGGYKEIVFTISGEGVYGMMKYESGVHRVQRVPQTEAQGRVHTSAASVVVLPEAGEFDVELKMSDIRKDTAKDADKPFIVETFAYDVKVLGTKFNIIAEEQTGDFSTALLEGRVSILDKTETAVAELRPDQIATLVDGRLHKVQSENLASQYRWTEGIVNCGGLSFTDVLTKFEKTFGVDIRIEKTNIPDKKIRYMKVYVSDGPAAALELLQNVVDFDYSYDQKTNTYLVR